MPVEIELDVFSGRPNPRWLLSPSQEIEWAIRLDSLPNAAGQDMPEPPGLGYRGFTVRADKQVRVYGGLAQIDDETYLDVRRNLEKWLLSTSGSSVDESIKEMVATELGRS